MFTINDDFVNIIKSILPSCRKVQKIEHAWTNFVFDAETDEGTYVFRFPRNDFFSNALEKEIEISKLIYGKTTIQTNLLLKKEDLGRTFSMHKKIEGECLTKVYDKLTQEEIKGIALEISNFIRELQEQKIDNLESLTDFLIGLSKVNKYEDYDFKKLEIVRKLEKENSVFCHGDLNPGNIIVKEGKVVGVIDFAFACKSNLLVDLSRIIGRLPREFSETFVSTFEKVFQIKVDRNEVEKLIKLWSYVEKNYIGYVEKECSDIVLPIFFN